jgi:hypothetical protein
MSSEIHEMEITKEMADYSAMKSYLKKNNLHYFPFSSNTEKPIRAVIRHLPPDTPAEYISNSLENLGFSMINVRQLTIRRAPNGQIYVENLPLFHVTLTRNVKSREIFKLNSLNHISIKVESYRAQTGLTQCHNCQNFGHAWANCNQLPQCLWCGGGQLHRECPEKIQNLHRVVQLHPSRRRETSSSVVSKSHAKEELQRRKHNELPRDHLGGSSSLSSHHQSSPTQLHCVKTIKTSNQRHGRIIVRIMVITKMVLNLMQQNVC